MHNHIYRSTYIQHSAIHDIPHQSLPTIIRRGWSLSSNQTYQVLARWCRCYAKTAATPVMPRPPPRADQAETPQYRVRAYGPTVRAYGPRPCGSRAHPRAHQPTGLRAHGTGPRAYGPRPWLTGPPTPTGLWAHGPTGPGPALGLRAHGPTVRAHGPTGPRAWGHSGVNGQEVGKMRIRSNQFSKI